MKNVRKLLKFLKPYWMWALLAPALMVVEVAMDLMQPQRIQRIIDVGIKQLDMAIVGQTGLQMVGFALIGAIGGFGCTIFATLVAQGFGADLREALFSKVQSLSFGNLDELETGQLITRLTNDVTQVQQVVGMALRIMVRAPLLLVGSLIMAIITSPQLALLLLGLGPLVLIVIILIISKAAPLFTKVQGKLDNLNTVIQENLAGVRVIKAFVRADYEIQRFTATNEYLRGYTLRAARIVAVAMPFMMLALNFGAVGAIWFGGIQISAGTMEVGQIIAFVNYLMNTLMSLLMVSMLVMMTARAKASADRIQEVLDSQPHIQSKSAPAKKLQAQGRISFENVTFSYDKKDHDPVLKNISFSAEPGETVAILGATGAGKSSLIHLIPRFYDISEGRVTFDGTDVRDIDPEALRGNIGIALQEAVLFSGSIRDNIRYGRPEASDAEVITAAKAAQAHDFISQLNDGYDTQLGQRGVNLSGGQKQRLAIARALLIQPAVLILDDSTSAVDVETEIKIQDALDELMRERTSFIVAQRISTVLNADKILVLDDGQIAAEGIHSDLLASSPIYQEIYKSQLGNGK